MSDHNSPIRGIMEQLKRFERRRRVRFLLEAVALCGSVVPMTILLVALIGGYWSDQPPIVIRWILLLSLTGAVGSMLALIAIRAWVNRFNPAQAARFIERRIPELDNHLINAILLNQEAHRSNTELIDGALRESAEKIRKTDLQRAIDTKRLRQRTGAAIFACVLLVFFAAFQTRPFVRGVLAALHPSSFVPAFNTVEIREITPGDTTVFAGQSVTLTARIDNPDRSPLKGKVLLENEDTPREMLVSDSFSEFVLPLGRVDQTLRYAIRIGKNRYPASKPWYTIRAIQKLKIESAEIEIDFPDYVERKNQKTKLNTNAPTLEAPTGSRVTLTLTFSDPVPVAAFDRKDSDRQRMARSDDGKTFRYRFRIDRDDAYRIILQDEANRLLTQFPDATDSVSNADANGGFYRIDAISDPPPKVAFAEPGADTSAAPGDSVHMRVSASDMYGLREIRLLSWRQNDPPEVITNKTCNNAKTDALTFQFRIPQDLPDDGSVVLHYRAEATDRRALPQREGLPAGKLGPQTTSTPQYKITVRDSETLEKRIQKRRDELRNRLRAMLELQTSLRVKTDICISRSVESEDEKAIRDLASKSDAIGSGQRRLRDDMQGLLQNFAFEADMATAQQVIGVLVANETRLAIDQANVLSAAIRNQTDPNRAAKNLAQTQDKIIDALETLLAIVSEFGRDENDRDTSSEKLPPETREKLRELKNKLGEFIEEQKKAIETSNRLAETPIDDFTDTDKELLDDLQATQDKWEKFFNESFADFSRIAEQDFSNPVMMKELLSVKNDVTMAKDALKENAIEVATALENNAVENAETLTANVEKWLPDVPDRTKWAMEAPDEQKNIEMPELPEQLEDLVGDLLEQEEDLFEEMDDITSKAAGSFDKGAGWDAKDGPISSLNAQGVTGNQLPNSSEISGRSGEGRTGKSVGEYVEDKAVGKGGRRTPTRLTGEPFSQGHIDDKSKDPPGGATGGGKLSGAGGEGLEGPVPPALKKELDRLAGKQAKILQRAKRLQAGFGVNNYANFKLIQAITLMDRVRGDLQRYDYQNALRKRRATTGALRETGVLTSGKINVSADASTSMPKRVREEISDAMDRKLPVRFRTAVEQYYRRISR